MAYLDYHVKPKFDMLIFASSLGIISQNLHVEGAFASSSVKQEFLLHNLSLLSPALILLPKAYFGASVRDLLDPNRVRALRKQIDPFIAQRVEVFAAPGYLSAKLCLKELVLGPLRVDYLKFALYC